MVGTGGFEPPTSCSQSRRANQAAPRPDKNRFSSFRYYQTAPKGYSYAQFVIKLPEPPVSCSFSQDRRSFLEGRQGLRPVADLIFDLRPQLGHGGGILRHPEDRVVAEAGLALGLKSDNAGALAPGPAGDARRARPGRARTRSGPPARPRGRFCSSSKSLPQLSASVGGRGAVRSWA